MKAEGNNDARAENISLTVHGVFSLFAFVFDAASIIMAYEFVKSPFSYVARASASESTNVTLCINSTVNETNTVTNIPVDGAATVTFTWNTTEFAYGNYTISAYAAPVPGETNTADNNFTSGWVIVSIPGDIAGKNGLPDGKVDMRDIATVAAAFGSRPADSWWNANADINNDMKVDMKDDMKDIAIAAANFGQGVS